MNAKTTIKNLAGMFRNTRTRTIILLTVAVLLVGVIVGIFRLGGGGRGPATEATLRSTPSIQSVPGGFDNPESPEYIRLQEKQNLQQAKIAQQQGTSAIPTIVRSSEFPGPPGPTAPGSANTCCIPCGCPAAGGGVGGLGASQACSLQPGTLSYDPQGRVMGTVGPDGKIRNANGNNIGAVGPDGLVRGPNNVVIGGVGSVIAGMPIYNPLGKTVGRVGPDGKARDASGTVIGTVTPDGVTRDMYGNILGKTASSLAGTAVYNNQSRLIGTVGPDGKVRDSAGRVIGAVDCDGTVRDTNGDVVGKTGSVVAGATPVCNDQNQPLGTAGPDGRVRDVEGRIIGTIGANGVVLDAAGKVIGKSGCIFPIPKQGVVAGTPVYDSQGRLIGIAGADGKVRDANGKIIGTVGPDGIVRDSATGAILGKVGAAVPGTPVYDAQGRLIGTVGADGKVRDANGNIIGTVGPDGVVRDANGKVIGKTGPTITGTPIYDAQGRLIGIAGPDGKVRDSDGKVIGTVGPDGVVRDPDGNVIGTTTAPGATPAGGLPAATASQQLAAIQALTPSPSETAARTQAEIARRQAALVSKQEAEQMKSQYQGAMTGQAGQLIAAWVSPFQAYVEGTPPPAQAVMGQRGGMLVGRAGVPGRAGGISTAEAAPIVKAGTVMYGVLITSVNSDEPGPVLATIVVGKFKGGKLIGSLTNQGEKVMLTFNTLTLPSSPASISVNVVAIDQCTARTALSSHTDHHYLLRYGTLFAASFIQGYGQAFQTSGQTVISTGLATATTTPVLSPQGKFFVALGNVGTRYSSVLGNVFNTPPTVHVYSGTALGLLFLSDVPPIPVSAPDTTGTLISASSDASLIMGALGTTTGGACSTCPR